jgi:AhpD family alkylhydroperoxidase
MSERLRINETDAQAYEPMYAFDKYLAKSLLKPEHNSLIKLRVSQLNHCAYCIDKHTKELRKLGETEHRIYALNAWRDTHFFNEEEQAILCLVEEITFISEKGVSDDTFNKARELLGDKYLANVIMAIISINAWNRIGISTKMSPVKE